MKQKLLTIVVPVYKVEPYINKCLDSCILDDEKLMEQLEVIIVNDGTPDNSAEMSREYVKRYPKTFRQIDKENGGHGSAWNAGLKEATGKYLRFLDSDDWLVNLEKFMIDISHCDTDLVFTQMDKFMVEMNELVRFPVVEECNIVKSINSFPYWKTNDFIVANFHYCTYKTKMLQPLYPLFDEHVFYDDMILHIVPIFLANDYIVYDYPLYQYLIGRAGQTMSPENMRKHVAFHRQEILKEYAFYLLHKDYASEHQRLWGAHVLLSCAGQSYIPKLPELSWREFKKQAKYYRYLIFALGELPKVNKQTRRLLKYPLCLTYVLEKIRLWKNKK